MREIGWPSLKDRRKGSKLKNLNKILNKEVPLYLQKLIPDKIGVNRPQSRNSDNFHLLKTRTETFRNSFIPSSIRLWNSLDIQNRTLEYCRNIMSQTKSPLLYYGNRISSIKHAQLRMECSKLNHHLHLLHVIDSPKCDCGYECENTNHFLLECPLYYQERTHMLHNFSTICDLSVSCNILLFGSEDVDLDVNKKIFDVVHSFINDTDRL